LAKAREIPGLSEQDSYAAAAAKVVAVRSQELADHAEGVLDVGDFERVHDMRVATRRLRAALEVFEPCFPRKRLRADLREVKRLADALGERRDRDVAIAELGELSTKMAAPDRAGIESLVGQLREEQRRANEELAGFVTPDRLQSLQERLRELVGEAWALAPEDPRGAPVPPPQEPARRPAPAANRRTDGAGG
jgi:CHAD domain-containing protein